MIVVSTTLAELLHEGTLRNGRRTPETVYASFSEDLDDRTTNYPVTWIPDVDLARFMVQATNEKLQRERRVTNHQPQNSEPEITFQECMAHELTPGTPEFTQVIRFAGTYAADCINRFLTAGFHVEVEMDSGERAEGKVTLEGEEIIVRPR